jgi:hypothetical protein
VKLKNWMAYQEGWRCLVASLCVAAIEYARFVPKLPKSQQRQTGIHPTASKSTLAVLESTSSRYSPSFCALPVRKEAWRFIICVQSTLVLKLRELSLLGIQGRAASLSSGGLYRHPLAHRNDV